MRSTPPTTTLDAAAASALEPRAHPYASVAAPIVRAHERTYTYVRCNLCGRDVSRGVHNISRLVQCVGCGLIFVNPRPPLEELAGQYDDTYFHCAEPTFGGYEDYEADREDIRRTFRGRLRLLEPLVKASSPRLLDAGCATGVFLEVARDAGWAVEGLDISAYAVEQATQRGFGVRRGTLPDPSIPSGSFDVITLWDVIEHVPDPAAIVAECHRLLRPGGVIAMSTPDAGSLPARILKGKWLGFRSIDEHLYFFSRATMEAMLARAGFRVARFHDVGKYLTLPRLIERMRFYSRMAALMLRAVDRFLPRLSISVNPHDTMCVIAIREDS
jgi:2-polyprenyl-3-methyl-5-hydroxy-6-metoxy-1,4-benzoquinol methylase